MNNMKNTTDLHKLANYLKAKLNRDLYQKGSLCYCCINYDYCSRVKDHRRCSNFEKKVSTQKC